MENDKSSKNNNPHVDISLDLTKVAENVYKDALSTPLTNCSEIVSTTIKFVHNTLFYPLQKYNLYAQNKLDQFKKDLESNALNIPHEHLVSPKINILGPTVESLKYNLDENELKEMFMNILLADMDNRKQNKVFPCYIEIINQLSSEDARILKILKKNIDTLYDRQSSFLFSFDNSKKQLTYSDMRVPLLSLKSKKIQPYDCIDLDKFIIEESNQLYLTKLDGITIDNLERLNLIKIYDNQSILENNIYDKAFHSVFYNYVVNGDYQVCFEPGVLQITNLGHRLLDICISKEDDFN